MSPLPIRGMVVGLVVAVVAGAVVAGLIVAGSPAEERLRRLDERRLTDLRGISASVNAFSRREARLPASLEALPSRPDETLVIRDPETGAAYGYRVLGLKYELCAEFQRPTVDENTSESPTSPFWRHPAGRHCFVLEAPVGSR